MSNLASFLFSPPFTPKLQGRCSIRIKTRNRDIQKVQCFKKSQDDHWDVKTRETQKDHNATIVLLQRKQRNVFQEAWKASHQLSELDFLIFWIITKELDHTISCQIYLSFYKSIGLKTSWRENFSQLWQNHLKLIKISTKLTNLKKIVIICRNLLIHVHEVKPSTLRAVRWKSKLKKNLKHIKVWCTSCCSEM